MSFKYDVFFSYRHKPLDAEITEKVFHWFENYKLPASLKEKGAKDIERAFRDTEELPVRRILTETIDEALRSANVLVVVCSTDTPSSEWVDREIELFIEFGRAEHVYPLLINGDENTSFPPSLKKIPDIAERVMDVRTEGGTAKEILKKAPDELLKAVADITGCDPGELRRENSFRKSRQTVRRTVSIAAILVFVGIVSYLLMSLAQNYRTKAQLQEQATLRILSELTYDLPDHLTDVPGTYSRIAKILEENAETIDHIIGLSKNKSKAVVEASANREKLANARSVLGMYEEALEAQDTAIVSYETLAADGKDDLVLAYGSSYNNRGNILHAAGRYSEAETDYQKSAGILKSMKNPDRLVLARIYGNLAANAVSMGEDSADSYFQEALSLLDENTNDPEYIREAASILYNRGVGLYRAGRYEEAAGALELSAQKDLILLDAADNRQNHMTYMNCLSILAACLTDSGEYEKAENNYQIAEKEAEELAKDTENRKDQILLADLYNNYGLFLNSQGKYEAADGLYRKAAGLYGQIFEATGSVSSGTVYAVAQLNTGENAFKAGKYAEAEQSFKDGLAVFEKILSDLDAYDQAQYYTWLSYHRLINLRDYNGAYEAAVNACTLQPNSILANMNLGYACLYCGYEEECDRVLRAVAAAGKGQAEMIRNDLKAQGSAGLESDHTDAVLQMLKELYPELQ